MLRGGVAASASLVDLKAPNWSLVPAARTKDMQVRGQRLVDA